MSPHTVDERRDGHVEGGEQHDVVEQVLEEQDDSVGLIDGVDVVVEAVVPSR